MNDVLIWVGIVFCVTQSAMFSGLNLAFFSISKLRLEIESVKNNQDAIKIAKLREDSNFLLTTILWGNVGINVLLTLLSNSAMAGLSAFIFSTVIITFLGEIIPQAYFSRHAMRTASLLSPILRFYQFLLYPVAKPTSLALDKWLGDEAITFFKEKDLRELLQIHIDSPETEIDRVEGKGALNFLAIDDLSILKEGEPIDVKSIIEVPFENNQPVFAIKNCSCEDPFIKKMFASGKKWVIITDKTGEPKFALNSNDFIRSVMSENTNFDPAKLCHCPIVFKDDKTSLGVAISRLRVYPENLEDDVIDDDVILFWGEKEKRIVTGSDVLGRLLRGIAKNVDISYRKIKLDGKG